MEIERSGLPIPVNSTMVAKRELELQKRIIVSF
jgi:hypothetical protein